MKLKGKTGRGGECFISDLVKREGKNRQEWASACVCGSVSSILNLLINTAVKLKGKRVRGWNVLYPSLSREKESIDKSGHLHVSVGASLQYFNLVINIGVK